MLFYVDKLITCKSKVHELWLVACDMFPQLEIIFELVKHTSINWVAEVYSKVAKSVFMTCDLGPKLCCEVLILLKGKYDFWIYMYEQVWDVICLVHYT